MSLLKNFAFWTAILSGSTAFAENAIYFGKLGPFRASVKEFSANLRYTRLDEFERRVYQFRKEHRRAHEKSLASDLAHFSKDPYAIFNARFEREDHPTSWYTVPGGGLLQHVEVKTRARGWLVTGAPNPNAPHAVKSFKLKFYDSHGHLYLEMSGDADDLEFDSGALVLSGGLFEKFMATPNLRFLNFGVELLADGEPPAVLRFDRAQRARFLEGKKTASAGGDGWLLGFAKLIGCGGALSGSP